jgi:Ni/Co efflux regulator RcnB
MKAPIIAAALFSIVMVGANMSAYADDHDNHQYVHHDEWKKGGRIQNEDWNRGEHVDYRERHLRAPPDGYEWRQVDGNYVLAAVATGVIASVIVATATGH